MWLPSIWRTTKRRHGTGDDSVTLAKLVDFQVIQTLLGLDLSQSQASYIEYIRFWNQQCSKRAQHDDRYAAKTDQDVLDLVTRLSKSVHKQRHKIAKELGVDTFPGSSHTEICKSLDMVVRLWLMVNVTDDINEQPRTLPLRWRESESLQQLVERLFPRPLQVIQASFANAPVTMNHDFTAMSVRKFTQIDISWTNSLEDHLRLRFEDGTRVLKIFPHKAWLLRQLQTAESILIGPQVQEQPAIIPIYPTELLRETIWTLDLLFPSTDTKTLAFLSQQGQDIHHCDEFGNVEFPPVEIRKYNYWRDRLFDINNELQAPPRGLMYALVDYRNPLQWWTFFLAFLVTFLTIFVGVYQIVLAQLAYRVSLDQNNSIATTEGLVATKSYQ